MRHRPGASRVSIGQQPAVGVERIAPIPRELPLARQPACLAARRQTDLLDAQRNAVIAQVSAIEARYEALVEASRLSRAVGLLPTEPWSTLAQKELP